MNLPKRAGTALHLVDLLLAMLRSSFSNIFYKTIVEVMAMGGSGHTHAMRRRYLQRRKRLEQYLFAFYLLRALYVQYLILSDFPVNPLWRVDYVAPFIRENRSYDPLFFLCLTLMGVFIFTATQNLYVGSAEKASAWTFFHALIVENLDAYRRSLLPPEEVEERMLKRRKELGKMVLSRRKNSKKSWQFFEPFFVIFQRYYIRWAARCSVLYNLDYVDKEALMEGRGRLATIQLEIPISLRVRLLRVILFTEKAMFVYQVGFCKF